MMAEIRSIRPEDDHCGSLSSLLSENAHCAENRKYLVEALTHKRQRGILRRRKMLKAAFQVQTVSSCMPKHAVSCRCCRPKCRDRWPSVVCVKACCRHSVVVTWWPSTGTTALNKACAGVFGGAAYAENIILRRGIESRIATRCSS
jgi:hypothetical protein